MDGNIQLSSIGNYPSTPSSHRNTITPTLCLSQLCHHHPSKNIWCQKHLPMCLPTHPLYLNLNVVRNSILHQHPFTLVIKQTQTNVLHYRSQLIPLCIKKLHPTWMSRPQPELEPRLMTMSTLCVSSLLKHVGSMRFVSSPMSLCLILSKLLSGHVNAGAMPVRNSMPITPFQTISSPS